MSDTDDVPPALARLKTPEGIESMWREIALKIYSPRVLEGLPPYLDRIAFAFAWGVEPEQIPRSIREGDVALFVALLIRLDQIDAAMVALDRTEGERAPVLYARHIVEGFRAAAEQQLVRRGGQWPPQASSDGDPADKSRASGSRSARRGRSSGAARPTRS